jgi:hypothetical protein
LGNLRVEELTVRMRLEEVLDDLDMTGHLLPLPLVISVGLSSGRQAELVHDLEVLLDQLVATKLFRVSDIELELLLSDVREEEQGCVVEVSTRRFTLTANNLWLVILPSRKGASSQSGHTWPSLISFSACLFLYCAKPGDSDSGFMSSSRLGLV